MRTTIFVPVKKVKTKNGFNVAEAILRLISKDTYGLKYPKGAEVVPVLVSKTESIFKGDTYMNFTAHDNSLYLAMFDLRHDATIGGKILALPDNFSDELLKKIKEGKLKDGDKVLVVCEPSFDGWQIKFDSNMLISINPDKVNIDSQETDVVEIIASLNKKISGMLPKAQVRKLCKRAMEIGEGNGLDDSHGTAQPLDKIFKTFVKENKLK